MTTTVRVNNEIKEQVMPIFNTLGISLSDAINMFLHQVKIYNGIPFDLIVRAPNAQLHEAMEETEQILAEYANGTRKAKPFLNAKAMLEEMNAAMDAEDAAEGIL
ncbi:MAG: type II toxin-antitoxin system RelB/DinJ family antitoxin [Defluviitaleaceae bacterium]|nr:type II toxin-antitoxin system RelB/DinJ family antitoxin [Defluviitaleaceae bacterium]MCL2274925.1 type II toxin-antitoxin system RelB/DinJ family antitoxin [Defluviitaleaceae bacterium]